MHEPSLAWGAEALWRQLKPLLPGLSVEILARVGSTNSALLDRARARHAPETDDGLVQARRSAAGEAFGRRAADIQPCLLVAQHQTQGRGRHGRAWTSAAGASLTFSLSLPLTLRHGSGLALAVGLALAEALEPAPGAGGPRIGLKWPNDLWLLDGPIAGDGPAPAGRKLGGVLIETVSAAGTRLVVIGVGLNVLPVEADEATTGVACVQEIDPATSAPAVLARVARPLVEAVLAFEAQGFPQFAQRYAARDVLRGRVVRTTDPAAPEGVAEGLSPQGELMLRTGDGQHAVIGGEVTVRPQPPAADTATAQC
jgi:BirA family biotin operon repressor/biotin-[acetyl-CoA-carboxylase] ligase